MTHKERMIKLDKQLKRGDKLIAKSKEILAKGDEVLGKPDARTRKQLDDLNAMKFGKIRG